MSNNLSKYIFAIFIIGIIILTVIVINKEKNIKNIQGESENLESQEEQIQKDLRLGITDLDTFNPLISNNRNVYEYSKLFYDSLIKLDAKFKPHLCLAENIEELSKLEYKVTVKDNVKWNNAQGNLTAEDVRFTIEQISKTDGIYKQNISTISEVQVNDAKTIIIRLNREDPYLKYKLNFPIMKSVDPEFFVDKEKNHIPANIGLYNYVGQENNIYIFRLNPNYFNKEKKPKINEIRITKYDSSGELYNAFRSGNIDFMTTNILNIEEYIGDFGYQKISYKHRDYTFMPFNTERIQDKNLRKAMLLVLDIPKLLDGMDRRLAKTSSPLDFGHWVYTQDLNIQSNQNEAREIMQTSGYSLANGKWVDDNLNVVTFKILVNDQNNEHKTIAEKIKNELDGFGFNIILEVVSSKVYKNNVENRNYDAAIVTVRNSYSPDVSSFYSETGYSKYSNQEVKEILESVKTANDDIIKEQFVKLGNIYLEDAPFISLYRNTSTLILSGGLVNNITPNASDNFYSIDKWYRK